ncbi:hypothetical protein FQN57_003072 [Myotisia sp. PD_48]|nr:hypothetical protein FQN57_003072 [Myotisia sp. PD_48]
MFRQVTLGDVDFVTGDYLAEMNIAEHAEGLATGNHPGYDPYAFDGLELSIDAISKAGVKVILNAGALNPKGLAEEVAGLVRDRGYTLKVAYVSGDNLLEEVRNGLATGSLTAHLDSDNKDIRLDDRALDLLDTVNKPVVSANAYLGARAIVKGLQEGADIIICGRVADASPVIGAAWYWHSWIDTDYDRLAGALVAGHLIECSAYVTGSNFSGFTEFDLDNFIDLPFGIAEVDEDGSTIITKHLNTKGVVNVDVVKCQFLYELQGNIYLNSDVKANLNNIVIEAVGEDRVKLSGVTGAPPPTTTKLAIFYRGGYEGQILLNATGYGTKEKWDLFERQIRFGLQKSTHGKDLQFLEFQRIGTPRSNPTNQLESTTYCRVFAQGTEQSILAILATMREYTMQHFSGFHLSRDMRTATPRPFHAFYPGVYPQSALNEMVHLLAPDGEVVNSIPAGHPPKFEALENRENYDTRYPIDIKSLGETRLVKFGDIALARSGDKGANINFGAFVRTAGQWDWFRTYMTRDAMRLLLGEDDAEYHIERVEFPNLWAVHFVIYGILGRGVSSSTKLDSLGKGFADYIRDKLIEVPVQFLD